MFLNLSYACKGYRNFFEGCSLVRVHQTYIIMTISERYNHFMHDLEGLQFHIMAFSVLIYCCVLIPFTVLSIEITHAPGIELILAMLGGFAIVIANLDNAPVRLIFRVFIIASVIDLAIILVNFFV